jgi:hypothetical protein
MRTRTLSALAAGVFACLAIAQQPPANPKQPPATVPTPTQAPTQGAPAPNAAPSWPKEFGGKDLKAWLADLSSPDALVRQTAVTVIPHFGPDAREPAHKPLLAALARERDPGVKINIIDLVGNIGAKNAAEAKEIARALTVQLSNAGLGGPTRLHAIHALTNYGPDAHEAVPAVLAVITDPSWETRREAAIALGRLAYVPETKENKDAKKGPGTAALKSLLNLMKDECAAVRLEAVESLVMLGPPAYKEDVEYAQIIKPYLDAVTARQKVEPDKATQVWLYVLVMRYDGTQFNETTIGKIAEYLKEAEPPAARHHALTALAMLGPMAKPFVLKMAQFGLRYKEPELVFHTIMSLAALGENALPALPDLQGFKALTAKEKGSEMLSLAAGEAIDMITGKKKQMAPAAPPPAAGAAKMP